MSASSRQARIDLILYALIHADKRLPRLGQFVAVCLEIAVH